MRFKNFLGLVFCTGLAFLPDLSNAAYQFSEYGFSRNPARVGNSLRITSTGRTSLRSYRFVGRVGGVNFEEKIDLSNHEIKFDYDSENPNGERASIIVNDENFSLPLYDWELKPIVQFSDSEYTAVVSIFGSGPEPDKYNYIDYHPAFEDTHLGMRLLQADIILTDFITFSEAPVENGEKVYYPGEAREQPLPARIMSGIVANAILGSEPYQAWVLTDTDVEGSASFENGVATVDLKPYYHVWKAVENKGLERLARDRSLLSVEVTLERLEYFQAVGAHSRALAGTEAKRIAAERMERLGNELQLKIDQLDGMDAAIGDPEIVKVDGIVARLENEQSRFEKAAPFVFDGVIKTAQYSALFRGAKESHPDEWRDFVREVEGSVNLKFVETPNQFRKPSEQ